MWHAAIVEFWSRVVWFCFLKVAEMQRLALSPSVGKVECMCFGQCIPVGARQNVGAANMPIVIYHDLDDACLPTKGNADNSVP